MLSAYRVELTKNHSAFVQTVISREHNIFKGNCLVHVKYSVDSVESSVAINDSLELYSVISQLKKL